jgi:serine/threonine protein kinase
LAPDRWLQIAELYHSAREHGPQALANADPELRREVEELLAQNSGDRDTDQSAAQLRPELTLSNARVGSLLGPYRIEGVLGAGGMGQVYRATDTRLGRSVAVKVVHKEFNSRFEHEARAIANLNHPHICILHDVGPNYLVMELVPGQTLAERLNSGAISIDEALRICIQIADALGAAHEKGIIHRDIKPANIKVTPSPITRSIRLRFCHSPTQAAIRKWNT